MTHQGQDNEAMAAVELIAQRGLVEEALVGERVH